MKKSYYFCKLYLLLLVLGVAAGFLPAFAQTMSTTQQFMSIGTRLDRPRLDPLLMAHSLYGDNLLEANAESTFPRQGIVGAGNIDLSPQNINSGITNGRFQELRFQHIIATSWQGIQAPAYSGTGPTRASGESSRTYQAIQQNPVYSSRQHPGNPSQTATKPIFPDVRASGNSATSLWTTLNSAFPTANSINNDNLNSANRRWSGFTVSNGTRRFQAGVHYISGNVNLENGGIIQIEPNAGSYRTVIYINGDLRLNNVSSRFRALDNTAARGQIIIIVSGDVIMNSGAEVTGTIIAPLGSIRLSNAAIIRGQALGNRINIIGFNGANSAAFDFVPIVMASDITAAPSNFLKTQCGSNRTENINVTLPPEVAGRLHPITVTYTVHEFANDAAANAASAGSVPARIGTDVSVSGGTLNFPLGTTVRQIPVGILHTAGNWDPIKAFRISFTVSYNSDEVFDIEKPADLIVTTRMDPSAVREFRPADPDLAISGLNNVIERGFATVREPQVIGTITPAPAPGVVYRVTRAWGFYTTDGTNNIATGPEHALATQWAADWFSIDNAGVIRTTGLYRGANPNMSIEVQAFNDANTCAPKGSVTTRNYQIPNSVRTPVRITGVTGPSGTFTHGDQLSFSTPLNFSVYVIHNDSTTDTIPFSDFARRGINVSVIDENVPTPTALGDISASPLRLEHAIHNNRRLRVTLPGRAAAPPIVQVHGIPAGNVGGVNNPFITTLRLNVERRQLTWNIGSGHGNLATVADKDFDYNLAAPTVTRAPTLSGVLSPDEVSVSAGTVAFETIGAGGPKGVTASGWGITGAHAVNYIAPVNQPSFANATIRPLEINAAHIINVVAPVVAVAPSLAANVAAESKFSILPGSVTWQEQLSPTGLFARNRAYTVQITLVPNENYIFVRAPATIAATVNSNTATVERIGDNIRLSYQFPATGAGTITGISVQNQPVLIYTHRQTLNLSALSAILHYNDGSSSNAIPFADFAANNITTRIDANPVGNTTVLLRADPTSGAFIHHDKPVTLVHNNSAITANTDNLTVNLAPIPANPGEILSYLNVNLDDQTYNGTARTVTVTPIPDRGLSQSDITVLYNGSSTPPVNAASYAVTVSIATGPNFSGTTSPQVLGNFTVHPRSINAPEVQIANIAASYPFTAAQITPSYSIVDNLATATIRTSGTTDYTVAHGANINAGTNTGSVTFTGRNNYQGTRTVNFNITRLELNPGPDPLNPSNPSHAVIFPTAAAVTFPAALSASALSPLSLSGTLINGTFAWVNPTTVPAVSNTGYPVRFTPSNAHNVDYSGVPGWDTATSSIVRNVAITVNPAVINTAAINVPVPSTGMSASTVATAAAGVNFGMSAITWSPALSGGVFAGETEYTATVTLTANANYVFRTPTLNTATVNSSASVQSGNSTNNVTLSLDFPLTGLRQIDGLNLVSDASNMRYIHDDRLNLSGLRLEITYNDGTADTVTHAQLGVRGIVASINHNDRLSFSPHNGQVIVFTLGAFTANSSALEVEQRDISLANARIRFNPPNPIYNGSSRIFPDVNYDVIVTVGEEDVILRREIDFASVYASNINAGVNTATVNVTGNSGVGALSGDNYIGFRTATFSIDTAVINLAQITVAAPVTGEDIPNTAEIVGGTNFTVSNVSWTHSTPPVPAATPGKFLGGTQYTVSVTLTRASANFTFTDGLSTATINGNPATVSAVNGETATLTFLFTTETSAATVSPGGGITIDHYPEFSYTHGETMNLAGLRVKLTYNDGTERLITNHAQLAENHITVSIPHGTRLVHSNSAHNGHAFFVRYRGETAFSDTASENVIVAQRQLELVSATHTKEFDDNYSATGVELVFDNISPGDEVRALTVNAVYTARSAGSKTVNITGITLTGGAAANYSVPSLPVNTKGLTAAAGAAAGAPVGITPQVITVTPFTNQSKFFNAVMPVLNFSHSPNLAGASDNSDFVANAKLSRDAGYNVGYYPFCIENMQAFAGNNYRIVLNSSDKFRINPLVINITPKAGQYKYFGQADPAFIFTRSPDLRSGDSFFGSLSYGNEADVGYYLFDMGTLRAGPNYATDGSNYHLVFTGGVSFRIEPAVIELADIYIPTPRKNVHPAKIDSNGIFIHDGENFSIVSAVWSPDDDPFAGGVEYTLTVTLAADANHIFAPIGDINAHFTIWKNAQEVDVENPYILSHKGDTLVLRHLFEPTQDRTIVSIKVTNDPDKLEYIHGEHLDLAGLRVRIEYSDEHVEENIPHYRFAEYGLVAEPAHGIVLIHLEHDGKMIAVNAPLDLVAYTSAIKITVHQADGRDDPNFTDPNDPQNWPRYADRFTAVFGDLLSSITFPEGSQWSWINADVAVGDVGERLHKAKFTPTNENFLALETDITVTVQPKPVTVTPKAGQSKLFGEADPVFEFDHSALIGEDQISGALGRQAGEEIGEYEYLLATLTAGGNYALALSTGVKFRIKSLTFCELHSWDVWSDWIVSHVATCELPGVMNRTRNCTLCSAINEAMRLILQLNGEDCGGSYARDGRDGAIYGIKPESTIVSEIARIFVITPQKAAGRMAIFDNLGNLVFTESNVGATGSRALVTDDEKISAHKSTVVWNLTNSAGRMVSNGTYLIVVEMRGENGELYRYAARIGVRR